MSYIFHAVRTNKGNRVCAICRTDQCADIQLSGTNVLFYLNYRWTHFKKNHNNEEEKLIIYSVCKLSQNELQYASEYKQVKCYFYQNSCTNNIIDNTVIS